MNFEPKIELNSPSTDNIVLDADDVDEVGVDPVVVEEETTLLHDLQGMTIHDLVQRVLLGACRAETYDKVEAVLVTRDLDLKQQIQLLQHELQNEKISRLHVEEELNKRDEICQKCTKLQETHEALLKDSKKAQKDLLEANGNIGLLREKNVKLMCEVNKLTREKVEAEKEFQVLSKMNEDLEGEINKLKVKKVEDGNVVQELEKLKDKRVEDGNALDVERRKNAELEHEVLKLKGNALDVERRKNAELEHELFSISEGDKSLMVYTRKPRKTVVIAGSSGVDHVEVPAPVAVLSASQVDPVANAPVAIPYVPDPTNGNKRKSKSLHVKDVKKAKVRSSHVKDVAKAKVRSSNRLRKLKTKMIAGPGKDASNPIVCN